MSTKSTDIRYFKARPPGRQRSVSAETRDVTSTFHGSATSHPGPAAQSRGHGNRPGGRSGGDAGPEGGDVVAHPLVDEPDQAGVRRGVAQRVVATDQQRGGADGHVVEQRLGDLLVAADQGGRVPGRAGRLRQRGPQPLVVQVLVRGVLQQPTGSLRLAGVTQADVLGGPVRDDGQRRSSRTEACSAPRRHASASGQAAGPGGSDGQRLSRLTTMPSWLLRAITTTASSSPGFSSRCGTYGGTKM